MTHGTRTSYQRGGCRCLLCRAAEAAYRADLRRRQALGKPILGQAVDASPAIRWVKALAIEGYTESVLAWQLGLPDRRLRWQTTRITLRNLLKLHRVYRQACRENNPNI